jgi:hypothetical protein
MASELIKQTTYDQDFNLWLLQTIDDLRMHRFDQLDLEHLIEELDDLSKRQKRELLNRLDTLLNHLLKRLYVSMPENYRSWEITIREQRKQLRQLIELSPSLKQDYGSFWAKAWCSALEDAREDYPDVRFPDFWPLASELEALLSIKFWED